MNEVISLENTVISEPKYGEVPVELGSTLAGSALVGALYGIGSGILLGQQVGVEVGVALTGVIGGIMLGSESAYGMVNFAREGKKVRAFLMSLKSTVEESAGFAIMGAAVGFHIDGPRGATWGGVIGGLWGASCFGVVNITTLAEAFREKHTLH